MIHFGYAQCDITPQEAMPLVGFYREEETCKGVLKPLLAQVSVWEDDSNSKKCLITVDSLGFTTDLTNELRDKVGNCLGIEREQVMFCFSHTHSAPDPTDSRFTYFDLVCGRVLAAVEEANSKLCPVDIGWDNVEADIGVNRRNKGAEVDKRVGILKVCEADTDEIRLIILRVTAHANSYKRDNYYVSPDFFGDIREIVGAHFNCPVMIVQGAAGNVALKYFCSEETPIDATGPEYTRSQNALADMANVILKELAPKMEMIKTSNLKEIDAYSREVVLTAPVPSAEEINKIAQDAEEICGIDSSGWLAEVHKLQENHIDKQSENVEVQYFKIGEWCLCGVPYEIMNEFATRAEQKLDNPYFYLNGYTNGCSTYFATEEEYDKGGYEVFWSLLIYYVYFHRLFPFEREACGQLIDFTVDKSKDE